MKITTSHAVTFILTVTLLPVRATQHQTGSSSPTKVTNASSAIFDYVSGAKDPVEKARRAQDATAILHHKLIQAISSRFPTRGHFAEFIHSVVKDEKSGLGWTCRLEVLRTLESLVLGEMWVIELLDSWGKPGPGILNMHALFRGDFLQCKKVRPYHPRISDNANAKDENSLYDQLLASFPSNRKDQHSQNPNPGLADENGNAQPIRDSDTTHVTKFNRSSLEWQSETYSHGNFNGNDVERPINVYNHALLDDVTRLLKAKRDSVKGADRKVMFKTKYCRVGAATQAFPMDYVEVPILKVYVGPSLDLCVPEDCTANDLNILVNMTIQAAMFGSSPGLFIPEQSYCHERIHLESKTIGVLCFIVVGLGWLAFATLFDLWRIQRPRWKLQRLKENFIRKRAALLKSTENGNSVSHDGNGYTDNGHGDVVINSNGERSNHSSHDGLPASLWTARGVEDGRPNESDGGPLEDILFKPPPITTGQRLVQFFSVYTNCSKILNTDVPPETLTTLHGVRFLSMCWIMIGHTLLIGLVSVANVVEFMNEMKQQTWFLIVTNGFLCVDTFFVVSGLMVGYFFKDISEHTSPYKWLVYVLHRFVRLTPAIMVTMAVYIGLWPYLSTGPGYPDKAPDEDMCRETWWYTLLYINNFLPLDKMCLLWTWYLSCDYQFYLCCTVFMIPLQRGYRKFGFTLAAMFVVASMITSGVVSYTNHLAEMLPQFVTRHGFSHPSVYYNLFYQKPYCRMGPYIVGLLLGYFLQRTRRNVKMPMWLVIGGWIVSTVVALTTLLGIHESWSGHHLMSDVEIAVYNATKHTAFGLCIGWVLFACLTGHGGYINTILTWKPFIPLSRLTYCTYLVHPIIIYLYFYSQNGAVWLNVYNLGFHALAVMMCSVVIGCGLSVFVESPTIQLEREILIRIGFIVPRNT